ncbi:hypothetical protein [Sediminicoccus sp. KRV36]|uniref:hypothetical protein n=1 Tax=Sediminicoccus sp. KRV36 TaxID=3133721 RepID=UPI0020108117|nr:hypothetical protein [Sediminicoccus rosea]UPY36818.1 hypothetical protein LHU95_21800 [Sediminicoccus rosea]
MPQLLLLLGATLCLGILIGRLVFGPGGVTQSANPCLFEICVGQPVPERALAGVAARTEANGELWIDARSRRFLDQVVEFGVGFVTPPPGERADQAAFRIRRDGAGRVTRVRLEVAFGLGSYLWAPHQQPALERALAEALPRLPPRQQIDAYRQTVGWQLQPGGIATQLRIWPGSGLGAGAMLEIGRSDIVGRPQR